MELPPNNRHTFFDCLSPGGGAALATALAQALSEGLSADQINVFANFLSAVGQSMSYISAQMELNEELCPKPKTKTVTADKEEKDTDTSGKLEEE